MSCEAKVWWENDGWHGIHDGECQEEYHKKSGHHESEYGLSSLLAEIEKCYFKNDRTMRWYFRHYDVGTQEQVGLIGYAR